MAIRSRPPRPSISWGAILTILGLVALIAGFIAIEASYATGAVTTSGVYSYSDYDEGAYTVSAQLLLAGYHLFSQVFSSQPAWFLESMALGMHVINNSTTTGARLVELFFGTLALAGVGWATWVAYGRLAALVAVIALGLSPAFVLFSHTIEAEMPMIGMGMLAIGAAAQYTRQRNRLFLALSGVLLAGSAEMKLLAVVFIVPVALLMVVAVLGRHSSSITSDTTDPLANAESPDPELAGRGATVERLIEDLALLVAAALVPILITGGLLSPRDQFDQVIVFHLAASKIESLNMSSNIAALRTFLGLDPALLTLAAIGALAALVQKPSYAIVNIIWLLGSLGFMVIYHPFFSHQFAVILPPLAVLAGGALSGMGRVQSQLRGLSIVLAVLGIVAYCGWFGRVTWTRDQDLFTTASASPRTALAQFVADHTAPGDYVAIDDLFVAASAHRLVPPLLDDPSNVRAAAGYLTSAQLIDQTQRYHVRLVVIMRAFNHFPDYRTWLLQNGYHLVNTGIPVGQTYMR